MVMTQISCVFRLKNENVFTPKTRFIRTGKWFFRFSDGYLNIYHQSGKNQTNALKEAANTIPIKRIKRFVVATGNTALLPYITREEIHLRLISDYYDYPNNQYI